MFSGCGTFHKEVPSNTRRPGFEYNHYFFINHIFGVKIDKKEKIKRSGMAHYKFDAILVYLMHLI